MQYSAFRALLDPESTHTATVDEFTLRSKRFHLNFFDHHKEDVTAFINSISGIYKEYRWSFLRPGLFVTSVINIPRIYAKNAIFQRITPSLDDLERGKVIAGNHQFGYIHHHNRNAYFMGEPDAAQSLEMFVLIVAKDANDQDWRSGILKGVACHVDSRNMRPVSAGVRIVHARPAIERRITSNDLDFVSLCSLKPLSRLTQEEKALAHDLLIPTSGRMDVPKLIVDTPRRKKR